MAIDSDQIIPAPTEFHVTDREAGWRLDVFLAERLPRFSRTHLRRAITAGVVRVDDEGAKPSYRLVVGQRVTVATIELPREGPAPEPMELDVLYEDEHLIAVNKAPGVVVHPAKGHWSGTLTAGLAFHFENLSQIGGPTRPGIVHRLDRDTSGVLLVAKTDDAHMQLAAQFEAREVEKTYFAITRGVPRFDEDVIDAPIGPHPTHREKMAIRDRDPDSRAAVTRYRVIQRWTNFAALHLFPKTGRTHQLRVHLTHVGYPICCDRLYAGHATITKGQIFSTSDDEVVLDRQALHAWKIALKHPISGQPLSVEAPIRDDILRLQAMLNESPAQNVIRDKRRQAR